MNLPSYSTKLNEKSQELSQTREQKILSHLPENLDSIAQNSGTIKRKRGISSAVQLLKILFLYAASGLLVQCRKRTRKSRTMERDSTTTLQE